MAMGEMLFHRIRNSDSPKYLAGKSPYLLWNPVGNQLKHWWIIRPAMLDYQGVYKSELRNSSLSHQIQHYQLSKKCGTWSIFGWILIQRKISSSEYCKGGMVETTQAIGVTKCAAWAPLHEGQPSKKGHSKSSVPGHWCEQPRVQSINPWHLNVW